MHLASTGQDTPIRLLRASDEDRDGVVDQLRAHCASGRLTADELADRAQAAYAARTLGELDALLHDLPQPAQPTLGPLTRPPAPSRRWWFGQGRRIGPAGSLARMLGGFAAIGLPIALHGLSTSEAAIALVALPVVASIAGPAIVWTLAHTAPSALRWRHWICSAPGCLLILVLSLANSGLVALTGSNRSVTLWVFLGASMLLAAVRGDAGCEVLAIPNLVTGRQDQIGCLIYSPIDALEARRGAHLRAGVAGARDPG